MRGPVLHFVPDDRYAADFVRGPTARSICTTQYRCCCSSLHVAHPPVDVSVEKHLAENTQLRRLVTRLQSHVGLLPIAPHTIALELLPLRVDGAQRKLAGL